MRTPAHRLLSLIAATSVAVFVPAIALAQETTPPSPARGTPRPQDVDPAVNTSPPAAAPAPEPLRLQDLDPAVDTSSPGNAPASPPAAQGAAARKPTARGRGPDRLELDTTQITGNRELPKVLYIVPWKRSDLGDLVGKPVNSLLDEVLTPVDRDVFKRETRYFRALTPGADEGAGAAGDAKPHLAAPRPRTRHRRGGQPRVREQTRHRKRQCGAAPRG
jgi:hypothetical protein